MDIIVSGGYMSGYYCVRGVDDKFNIVLGVHSVFESSIGGVRLKNGIAHYMSAAYTINLSSGTVCCSFCTLVGYMLLHQVN